jgi:hypothetical protein
MSNGELAQAKPSGTKQGREVAVHSFKRHEKASVFPADNFQGATRIVSPIHQKCATNSVGNFRGGTFLPGIHSWGTDSTSKVRLFVLKELEESRKIAGVILTVSIHHGGVGPGGGKQACVEGGALAEILWEADDADIFLLREECGGAVVASVVHSDDFSLGKELAGFVENGDDILLLVIKGDDERKFGRHDLSGMEERGHSSKQFWKVFGSNFSPYGIGDLGNHPSVEHGKRDGGENVGGVVVARVNTT